MRNIIFVVNKPFPDWEKALDGEGTFIESASNGDGWAHSIGKHYRDAEALVTDLAPVWPQPGGDVWPIQFNGLNALIGAQLNSLPSFVYSPFTPDVIVENAYRAGCNAVVNSYKYSLSQFAKIMDACIKEDDNWIDPATGDLLYNQITCISDELLCCLTEQDARIFSSLVMEPSYEEVAVVTNLKPSTVRNKASAIFKQCGFASKTEAMIYAERSGLKGI